MALTRAHIQEDAPILDADSEIFESPIILDDDLQDGAPIRRDCGNSGAFYDVDDVSLCSNYL